MHQDDRVEKQQPEESAVVVVEWCGSASGDPDEATAAISDPRALRLVHPAGSTPRGLPPVDQLPMVSGDGWSERVLQCCARASFLAQLPHSGSRAKTATAALKKGFGWLGFCSTQLPLSLPR